MELNQVTLPSTDLARSVAFYTRLGFRLIVHDPPTYARFECRPDGPTFSLHRVATVAEDCAVVVYFECEDVDATVRSLEARGVRFELPPTDQPWLWRESHLRDPDGNRLCLYHAGRNRLHPPWRIES